MMVKYKPLKDWKTPRAGYFHIIKDHYWLVDDDGNPLISAKYRTPQCNHDKSIVERLKHNSCVQFFQTVFVPIEVVDFDYVIEEQA